MKFRQLPKEEQKRTLEAMRKAIIRKVARDKLIPLFYKDKGKQEKAWEGGKSAERMFYWLLEGAIWIQSRFWDWSVEDEKEEKEIIDESAEKTWQEINKNRKSRRQLERKLNKIKKLMNNKDKLERFINSMKSKLERMKKLTWKFKIFNKDKVEDLKL